MSQKNENTTQPVNARKYTTDPEFEGLFSKLPPEQYAKLKASIRKEGVRDPLVIWDEKDTLLDGHHRNEICKELGIKDIPTIRRSFPDRHSAKMWALQNQFTRRNMNSFQRAVSVLDSKDSVAKDAKANQKGGVRLEPNKGTIDTLLVLAKVAGVSRDAMYKVDVILKEAAAHPDNETLKKQIEDLHKGKANVSINSVYEALREAKDAKKGAGSKKPKDKSIKEASSKAIAEKVDHTITSLGDMEQQLHQPEDRIYFYDKVIEWARARKQAKKPTAPTQQK